MKSGKAYGILFLVLLCCAVMAFVETVLEPAYVVKSAIKVVVFLLLPLIFARAAGIKRFNPMFVPDKKRVLPLLALGFLIYAVIMGAYALTKNIFDYTALVQSLSADQNVEPASFLWVAAYISFCNSFLEEFLFRFVSFLELSHYASRKTAYLFSSIAFAVYHIAMIGTSFPPLLLFLALIGLTVGGYIFDYVDEKGEGVYYSWMIHMFADFAIMTIWYLHM